MALTRVPVYPGDTIHHPIFGRGHVTRVLDVGQPGGYCYVDFGRAALRMLNSAAAGLRVRS